MSRARPREWLPARALESEAVRRLVGEAVDAWGARWFVRAGPAACSNAGHAGAAPPRPGGWRTGNAVAFAMTGRQAFALAGLALGAEPERQPLTEADRGLIERFADAVCADLAASLARALGQDPVEMATVEDPFAGKGGLTFGVGERGDVPLVEIAIEAAGLVPVRKAACPSARRRAAPAGLGGALEAGPVRLEARLGKAILPLGDLAGLVPGDVLILDRGIDDGAELALAGSGAAFARGAIVPGSSRISLLLLPQQRD